ncbi:ComEC/Rec2 family competence protein [Pseudemcibacter aquimaris]|uniref:ComEC/Rec2 family competence protein n=1 Tax=Pseudemcibacter aquimaris TaxID=2857064 RepID=UPI002010EF3A|nr:ComEC/Rec2 family competence protein [Pseudemcibacter aquimaris]MCC3860895.1 ComEC/Rec2 family competence protein [Pseudemcibacter aquimaris]WDU59713.1 ComEC/Rec2 family competence protein [Pseudemcibacter aquimaris]
MVPVLMALGIGAYFSNFLKLPLINISIITTSLLVISLMIRKHFALINLCTLASFFIALGNLSASYRVNTLGTVTLQKEIRPTNISGTVEKVHLYEDGKIRLTLKDTEIYDTPPLTLVNVRVNKFDEMPYPGDKIKIRAGLMPPPGPSMPGDYDYGRQVWFQGLSAVGYSVSALEITEKGTGVSRSFNQIRQRMAERIRGHLPGETGTLAAALITGIRGGMPESLAEAMRDAGLAHLLAISGLHMGLLCGVVFFTARFILSFSPRLALGYPIKKWSAVIAGLAGLGYLFISGASIPTVRAFIMVIIVFLGILADRKAISLRLVAIAAIYLLVSSPESLIGVSFQMSFAAVVALVVVFERFGNDFMNKFRGDSGLRQKLVYFVVGSLFTSLIAELAIAPFALYHFNKVVLYGLLANLIAMPVMGSWVMPWIVVTLVLMPFGLEWLALEPMSWGLEVIMAVAYWVSGLPGSTLEIPAIDIKALVFLVLGALWLGIWKLRWRFLGIPIMLLGLVFAVTYKQPDILIDNAGKTIAIRGDDNSLSLSRMNGSRIVKDRWRQRYGLSELERWEYDSFTPDQAAGRELSCDTMSCLYRPNRSDLIVSLVQDEQALPEDCANSDVIISLVPVEINCSAKVVLDRWDFYNNGGYALWLPENGNDDVEMQNVKSSRGDFPWVN